MAVDSDIEALPGRAVSLWRDGGERRANPPLQTDLEVDVVVVGAGIVGLSTAIELARDGAEVAVLQARAVGAGVSGHTTAKLSSLQGLRLAPIVSTHGVDKARAYAEANEWGIRRVESLVAELEIECDLRRQPNFTYTEDPEHEREIEGEVEAALAAGLPAAFTRETDLPFEVAAAIRLDDQAELQPVAYLEGLAAELDRAGPGVYERTRATSAAADRVGTAAGAEVRAGHVVVATQLPFLDRGLFFARAGVQRSYAISARLPGEVPAGMYLQAESPGRSLRAAPWHGDELLIVAGESHELGDGDPSEKFEALARYARARFGAQSFEHRWSAHDFMPDDGLPYVGRLWPLSDRMLTATGMGKWGLAMGVAAGRLLADQIGGRPNVWAETFDPRRLPPVSAVPRLGKLGAKSGYHLVADRLRHGGSVADLGPGEGRVIRDGLAQKAVHRDSDGVLHAVSARCTHLGCIVAWNAAEGTWDCPCHGSRFEAGGEVANGPATQPLHAVRPPETKEEEQMPPRGVKKGTKRARQYEKIKKSQKQQGRSEGRAEEIAARTVNKEKARKGESRTASRSSTKDISSGRRGGKRSGSSKAPRGRTRQQLYNEAAKLNIAGRSKMNKKQLQAAVNRKKGS